VIFKQARRRGIGLSEGQALIDFLPVAGTLNTAINQIPFLKQGPDRLIAAEGITHGWEHVLRAKEEYFPEVSTG